jgi:hypothetical protein
VIAVDVATSSILEGIDRILREGELEAGQSVEVKLGAPWAELRTLRGLPPVRARDLRRLVSTQLTRFFRQLPDDPVIVAEWTRQGSDPVALAALADEQVLDEIARRVEAMGSRVDRFVVPATDHEHSVPLELLTRAQRQRRTRVRLRRSIVMAALALGGWMVAFGTYLTDLILDARSIDAELAGTEGTLARLDSIEARMAAFLPVVEAAARTGPPAAWATATLLDVAESIPPSVHAHGMRIERANAIQLQAHADGLGLTEIRDSIAKYWSGSVRLDGERGSAQPAVSLVMERP